MTAGDPVQRIRIYLNERDMHEGQALYLAVLERLRHEGATGATALRGVAGFGPGHRAKAVGFLNVSDTTPLVIEWIDRVERIARLMPLIDDLLGEALVTVEDVQAYRARLRSNGPFGSQVVGEIMQRDVVVALPSTSIREAVRQLLERRRTAIVVADERSRPLALLTSIDLERRGGLPLPLHIVQALAPSEQAELLATLRDAPVQTAIAGEPRTAYVQVSIAQVVGTLIEWGLEAVPVVDREARLVGVVGVEQALRSSLLANSGDDGAVRDAEPSPPVRLLMQTSVPTVAAGVNAGLALRQLLGAPERCLVVVDEGKPAGMLDDAGVLATLAEPVRYAWLRALRDPQQASGAPFDGLADTTAGQLALPIVTIDELATQHEAIARIVEQHLVRLAVVDAEGRLVGLIGRRGLLRALAQESMA